MKTVIGIAMAFAATYAGASPGEEKLVGAWEPMPPADAAKWNPKELRQARENGFVVVYKADHTYEMYFPDCSGLSEALAKEGMRSFPGKWKMTRPDLLVQAIDQPGQPNEGEKIPLSWDGDRFILTNPRNNRKEVLIRYTGPLPPRC